MTEPRTPGNDEPTAQGTPPSQPQTAPGWTAQQPAPQWTPQDQPTQVFPAPDAAQPWYGAGPTPHAVDPGAVPPMPAMTPDAERKVPLLGRLPGAVVAAAAAGLLVIGVAGGFGVARATESTATTTAASTSQLGTGTVPGGTGTAPGGTGTTQGGTGTGTAPGGLGGRVGDGTVGTISAVDGASFTVQTPAGEDVTVVTDAATQVEAEAGTTVDALAVGDVVMVRGTAASDGSVTATLVVQGELRGGGAGTAPGATGTDPGTAAAPTTTTEGTTT